jgi:hypothetical protein
MSKEDLKGKIVIGTLHDDPAKTEFCDEYQNVIDRQRGGR